MGRPGQQRAGTGQDRNVKWVKADGIYGSDSPYGRDPDQEIDPNEVAAALFNETKKHPFKRMRNIFLRLASRQLQPSSLSEALSVIAALDDFTSDPRDADLRAQPAPKTNRLLLAVKATRVNELRNRVIHQWAYRPTRTEAQEAVEEAREILLPLGHELDILTDDINWYARSRHA